MSSSSDQNSVAKKRNQMLLDKVRSMLSSLKLHRSLWIEELKMTLDILNWVSTKAIPKTSFELWKSWNQVYDIYSFRDVCQRWEYITHERRS